MTPSQGWALVGLILFVVLYTWLLARHMRRVAAAAAPLLAPPLKRICANCQHFDLEEGQAAMARFPSFLRAAAALGPSQMGRKILRYDKHACDVCGATKRALLTSQLFDVTSVGTINGALDAVAFEPSDKTPYCHVCKGLGYIEQPVFEPTNLPAKARWEEFGACNELEQAVWQGDCCEKYVQLRVKP